MQIQHFWANFCNCFFEKNWRSRGSFGSQRPLGRPLPKSPLDPKDIFSTTENKFFLALLLIIQCKINKKNSCRLFISSSSNQIQIKSTSKHWFRVCNTCLFLRYTLLDPTDQVAQHPLLLGLEGLHCS